MKDVIVKEELPEFINSEIVQKLLDPEGNLVQLLEEEFKGLVITDHNDKDQIKVVHNAAQKVKAARAELNKRIGTIKTGVSKFQKSFKADGEVLVNGLNKVIDTLIATRDAAKLKAENEEKEAEIARANKYNERALLMFEAGYLNNGVQFVVGSLIVTAEGLEEIPESDFMHIVSNGAIEKERVDSFLAEAARIKEEDAARLKEEAEKEKREFRIENQRLKDEAFIANGSPVAVPESNAIESDVPKDFFNIKETRTISEEIGRKEIEDLPFGPADEVIKLAPIIDQVEEITTGNVPGYDLGFKACQQKIKFLFDDLPKMTRDDILKEILFLEP